MVITNVRVREVAIPRIYETYAADPRNLQPDTDHTRSVYQILELFTDEGPVGLGEVSDIAMRMNPPAPAALQDLLASVIVGSDVSDWRTTMSGLSERLSDSYHPELYNLTRFGVEIAFLDLVAKKYNAPLYQILGGRCRDRVAVSWVAYLRGDVALEEELKAFAEEIRQKVGEGFRAFKMKVGEDHGRDLARVRLFREIAGARAYLKVDVSGAWGFDGAPAGLQDLASAGANACETPIDAVSRSVANDDPDRINSNADDVARSLAQIRESSPLEIIEHVADFDDGFLTALIRHRAVDIINVIPSQGGGISRASRLLQTAQTAGIPALLGSTIEMGIGTAAYIHLCLASPNVTLPSDLISPGLLVDDVCRTPFQFQGGTLKPFERPGLGVDLDEERIARWQVPSRGIE